MCQSVLWPECDSNIMFNTLLLPQYIVTYHCFCQSLLYVRHIVLGAFAICSLPFAFSKCLRLLSVIIEPDARTQDYLPKRWGLNWTSVNPNLTAGFASIVFCCSAHFCGPIVFCFSQLDLTVSIIICYSKCFYQCCQAVSIKCKSNAVPLVFRFDEGSSSSAYLERNQDKPFIELVV